MSNGPAIVWVGFHEEGRFALPAIIANGFDVKAVLTLSDESAALRSGVHDFKAIAESAGIPCYKVDHINNESSIELLRTLKPNVLCVIGWSQILSAEALQTADITIGAHASLLPEGKGSAPINWALIKGLTRTGNTLIRLSEGVDEGDILAQREFEITDTDTCATLYDKVAESNESMLLEVLGLIRDGNLKPRPQPKTDQPLWPRRRPADGLINWNQDGRQVYDFVRALTRPYPGAFDHIYGQRVTVWCAASASVDAPPGSISTVQNADGSRSVRVACRNDGIELQEVEVEGVGLLKGEALATFFESMETFDSHD